MTMESSLATIQAVLTTTAPRWLSLTEILPAALLARQPAPGEWSAHECLQHLCDTERWVFPVRVRAFLAGQDFPGFDPDAEGSVAAERSPRDLAAEYAERRAESLAALTTIAAADLGRTARHSELGEVTLGQLLNEWAAHDLMHTVQAERALLQPFIPATGPWRSYFRDHDVAGG
jgi:hypothetical protein